MATDAALIKAGIASVTAVVPVVEDSSLDLAAALGPASWARRSRSVGPSAQRGRRPSSQLAKRRVSSAPNR